jgi:hypothetical protein
MATAGEWMTALQEEHHAAFAFEFTFILDDPALEIRRRDDPATSRHRAFPDRCEDDEPSQGSRIALPRERGEHGRPDRGRHWPGSLIVNQAC